MKCDSVWWVAWISWLGYIRESVHSVASVTNLQHQSEIFASLIQSLLGSVFWLLSPHREGNARRNGGQRATEWTFTRKLNCFCNIYTHPHVFFYRHFKEKSKFCYTDPSEHMYFMNASWAPFFKICLRLGILKKGSLLRNTPTTVCKIREGIHTKI